jgi:uncharacterized caspase-like protein
MKEAIKPFCGVVRRDLSASIVVLFCFCGHGVSSGGTNYFLPTNDDVPMEEWISATSVLQQFAQVNAKITFLLLDCCRSGSSSLGQPFDALGLSQLDAARKNKAFIVTACGPNQTSLERG